MPSLPPFYHIGQALLASYTAIYSYTSIRKVQTYESATKKAAKYSNTAENQLRTTQTTQGAGAVSILASFGTSIYLAFNPPSNVVAALVSAVLAVGITGAHSHISNHWRGRMKVPLPGSGDYNDAISTTGQMRTLLGGLAVSWGVVALWYFVSWVL